MNNKNDFLSNEQIRNSRECTKSKIKYIDLFSAIGGFHEALKSFSAECVLASEIDKKMLKGKKIDLLCAGFSCQSFS